MKKNFSLKQPGRADARVLEAIINDVRKYVKRERRKALPEGVDFWDFDCRVGADSAAAETKHWEEVVPAIEAAAKADDAAQVYVEILAKPGVRTKKPVAVAEGGGENFQPSTLNPERS
jgi:hypothetical protein